MTPKANLHLLKGMIGSSAASFHEEHLQTPDGSVDEEVLAIVCAADTSSGYLRIAGNPSCDGFFLSSSEPRLHDLGEYGKIVLTSAQWQGMANTNNIFVTQVELKQSDESQIILIELSDDSSWEISNAGDVIRLEQVL